MNGQRTFKPIPALDGVSPYRVPRHPAPVDLHLDGNEGMAPEPELLHSIADAGPELLRRYPSAAPLEALIARRWGVDTSHVLVTAGADDAIDRCCRAMLCAGREIVMPVPTFEMLPRYVHLTGATPRTVPWPDGAYPLKDVLAEITDRTSMIAVVSPNNPTGAVATEDDLRRLSEAAPHAIILLDLAYGEFADTDLTAAALALPNVVALRTLSKAWGMAGLRVGYVLGPAHVLGWLRALGQPYAVSGPSLLLVHARWQQPSDTKTTTYVERVRQERPRLAETLSRLGARTTASQANFVFARLPRSSWLRDGLAGLGIAVRIWPGHPELDGCIRITCPGDAGQFERLRSGVEAVLAPQALLFDMDGPLADVSGSYRRAVIDTAAGYGVRVSAEEIAAAKERGNANNDWVLTQSLLAERGVDVPLEAVTAKFELAYQGTAETRGLWTRETLVPERQLLERLSRRLPLAVVTGRPRGDALRFLRMHDLEGLFRAVVCMEDAPLKPDPAPVRRALELLGVRSAWMIGDTPDDIVAARGAGVVPLGVPSPGESVERAQSLRAAGAARVLQSLAILEEMLP